MLLILVGRCKTSKIHPTVLVPINTGRTNFSKTDFACESIRPERRRDGLIQRIEKGCIPNQSCTTILMVV
jgi:hypothetical protein